MKRFKYWLLCCIAATIGVTGCNEFKTDPSVTQAPSYGTTQAKLTHFDECGGLKAYVEAVYLNEQKQSWENYGGYPKGVPGDAVLNSDPVSTNTTSPTAPAPQVGTDSQTGTANTSTETTDKTPSFTETNNQVKGVDEADLVKTDGKTMYILAGASLYIVKAWPATEIKELALLKVGDSPREMFLYKNKVVIFSQSYFYGNGTNNSGIDVAMPPSTGLPETSPVAPGGTTVQPEKIAPEITGNRLRITTVDVTDSGNPKIVRDLYTQADYVSSRRIDGNVHVVLRGNLNGLPYVNYYGGVQSGVGVVGPPTTVSPGSAPSTGPGETGTDTTTKPLSPTDPTTANTLDEALAKLKNLLSEGKLAEWLPKYAVVVDGKVTESGQLSQCQDYYKPPVQLGTGVLTVLSFNLDGDVPKHATTAILGGSETVYSSASALYVATHIPNYNYWRDSDATVDFSLVHKFSYVGDGVNYAASGKIEGYILNQFSLDEHNGFLRVATSTQRWGLNDQAKNALYVLGQSGDNLTVVGSVTGLAPGERIYSSRFMGDRGFVVTFQQVDPLFTFDLSDPKAPKLKGELKVPGFSTYIHPLGDTHLLTIGKDTLVNGEIVRINGVQLAIYDVSDLSAPKQTHTVELGAGTDSVANYDHKAFTYFAERGLLAIPITDYQSDYRAGLKVFKVSTETGFKELGFITHDQLFASDKQPNYYWGGVQILRSVIIEQYVYSISGLGLLVTDTDTFTEMGKVVFTDAGYVGGCWEICAEPMPMPAVMP